MKRFYKRKEVRSLWAENGDLERLQSFFQTIESASAENEQGKQRIKQKVLQKMNDEALELSSALNADNKVSLGQRLRTGLQGMMGRRRWQIGVPAVSAVGLVILLIIWQGLPGPSGGLISRLYMASGVKQAQNEQTEVSPNKAGIPNPENEAKGQSEEKIAAIYPELDSAAKPEAFSDTDIASDAEPGAEATSTSDSETVPPSNTIADAKTGRATDPVKTPETEPESVPEAEAETDQPPVQDMVLFVEEIPHTITNSLSLTLEVSSVTDSLAKLSGEVRRLDGYVVGTQQGTGDIRSASYLKVDIPAAKLDQLCSLLAAEGKIVDKRLQDNSLSDDQVHAARADSAIVNIRLIGK